MRHQYTCIDFIEVAPANDVVPYPAIVASKPDDGAHSKLPPSVIWRIPTDWCLPDELRDEARLAGVQNPDAHLERLKAGPVGGRRGIFEDNLPAYVRSMFGKWRTWEETDRAKLMPKGEAPVVTPADRVNGLPPWVRKSQVLQAAKESRDIRALAMNFARTHHINPKNLDVNLAAQAFETYLERVRKEAA